MNAPLTVNSLLAFLEEVRGRGMGDAKIVFTDCNDEINQAGFVTDVNVKTNDDGDIVISDMHEGKPVVCIW